MFVYDYTPKSYAVIGPKTKEIKEELKKLGALYNSNLINPDTKLKDPGWIISKRAYNENTEAYNSIGVIFTPNSLSKLFDDLKKVTEALNTVSSAVEAQSKLSDNVQAHLKSSNTLEAQSELSETSDTVQAQSKDKLYKAVLELYPNCTMKAFESGCAVFENSV